MNCREFVDFLMSYIDGELPSEQQLIFERHLGDCPSCQDYLDSYRETVRLGRNVCDSPEGRVPEDAPAELVQAILAARLSQG